MLSAEVIGYTHATQDLGQSRIGHVADVIAYTHSTQDLGESRGFDYVMVYHALIRQLTCMRSKILAKAVSTFCSPKAFENGLWVNKKVETAFLRFDVLCVVGVYYWVCYVRM